jgi:DNA mismatch repair protein MutL
MGVRIHQLPPVIANQIAAGEVIERPASVVKELLENALDAGASSVAVEVGFGGLNQIKVSDNGQGIIAEDLPLALAAHATSKISTLDDLYAIDSMGFRGEALASIASIAKVSISSKPKEQEHAMQVQAQDGEISLFPCARSTGTTVDVSDLFYNAPVRKRFLKSEKLEFQAIETVVKRFALSAPHLHISLKHNGKMVLSLPAACSEEDKRLRLIKLFGTRFMQDAQSIDVSREGMRLQGWLSGSEYQRSQNDRQWVYINQRMVRDKLIHHALKQAYEALLYPGRFPACLLYLTMNSNEVDVNVHPTKHEVRFQQPRMVHDFITSALARALEGRSEHSPGSVHEAPAAYHQSKKTSMHSHDFFQESHERWIVLNNRFVLMRLQEVLYVVDVKKLHADWLQEQLLKASFPLASRPLLVPLTFGKKLEGQAFEALSQLGIELSNERTVRTVPIQLPYLDLMGFLDLISKSSCFDLPTLIKLVVASQSFDPRMLSLEEQLQLHPVLLNNTNTSVSKALTEEVCQVLLHV